MVAAGALFVFLTLPPRGVRLDRAANGNVAAGAYHVHTNRSDGTKSVDEIAAAAARAGLQFVVFTDHGDATRPPDPPAYRHGVLCIDAVEISTDAGHLVALGLDRPAPYPLGGNPVDVIDDIHRLGGRAIVAHPDSPDQELRWRGTEAMFDGLEWLSVDSEWRDEPPGSLTASAARALVRPTETIVSLFRRPDRTLRRWDTLAASRALPGLAAVDAHGGLLLGGDRGTRRGLALSWPGYEAMFRALSQHVLLEAPLSQQAQPDADVVIAAIESGRTFSVIDGYAAPATVRFTAEQAGERVTIGGHLPAAGVATTFRGAVPGAPGVRLVLLHNGTEIASGQGSLERTIEASPGGYRLEARFPGAAAPWIVTNHIGVGPREIVVEPEPKTPPSRELVRLPPDGNWRTELGGGSDASIRAEYNITLIFSYRLGATRESGPYAAIVRPVDRERDRGFDRIVVAARASRPMRVSLQVRLPVGPDGLRFRKSIYLDETPRTVIVELQDMQPVEPTTTQRPIVAHVQEMLVVVDTVNAAAGSEGTIWLNYVGLALGDTKGS